MTRLRSAEGVLRRGSQKTEVFEFGILDQSAEGLAQSLQKRKVYVEPSGGAQAPKGG